MREPIVRLHADELIVDNFAGGGGASTGIEMALGRSPDIAINHDPEALAMHAANHPTTRHYCTSVWDVDPVEACGGKPVGLAWFSPDCTFHSKARGAKPFRDRDQAKRRRGLAWVVVRWAKAVKPRVIALENVEEFENWGPLLDDGKPDPLCRGFTFRRWKKALENCGYVVESRELRACDYGAPTSRKRLFVVARCDGQPIAWPEPSHAGAVKVGAKPVPLRGRKPYRTAAECIDWTLPCPSIFERERPLAENTLRRIARGVRRYVLDDPSPFLVPYYSATSDGGHRVADPAEPLPTQTTANRFGLVVPTLIQTSWGERKGQAPRVPGLGFPIGTQMAGGIKHALVVAFLAKHFGGNYAGPSASLGGPTPTITTVDHHALVAAHLLKFRGSLDDRQVSGQGLDEPIGTVTASGTHYAQVCAFLLKYYGTEQDPRLDAPLHTITTKHRFALVTIHGVDYAIVDIGMRMLTPRELFRAQGFPEGYVIDPIVQKQRIVGKGRWAPFEQRLTKTAQVRMCGNSVPPHLTAAIVSSNCHVEEARQEALP